jgi:cytochrome c553
MGIQAASGQLEDITIRPENVAKRREMVKVCMTCHAEDRARGYLESADTPKLAGDALVIEGHEILAGLGAQSHETSGVRRATPGRRVRLRRPHLD